MIGMIEVYLTGRCNKINKFIMAQPKRMSLTLFAKCGIKQQLDSLIRADYCLLNEHSNEEQAILQCQLTQQNSILKEYIKVVEEEYNVPNPLNRHPTKTSSKKKLDLSILQLGREQLDARYADKNKKKLTLTTPTKDIQSSRVQVRPFYNQNMEVMTPKFQYMSAESEIESINGAPRTSLKSPAVKFHTNSANKLQSKEKPRSSLKEDSSHVNNSTAKKTQSPPPNESLISQLSHYNFESRATVKRQHNGEATNQYEGLELDESMHSNPIITKMQKRKLEDYCRPGRISNSMVRQESAKLKIKDSYRYCIGCEFAILEANIRSHEKECKQFQEISALPSNQEVLKVVRLKIASIEQRIPARNLEIEDSHAEAVRNRSASLVRESKSRAECSPESTNFRKDYESIMQIGKKWCNSMEEVNKLRWFTKIAQRLETLLAVEH